MPGARFLSLFWPCVCVCLRQDRQETGTCLLSLATMLFCLPTYLLHTLPLPHLPLSLPNLPFPHPYQPVHYTSHSAAYLLAQLTRATLLCLHHIPCSTLPVPASCHHRPCHLPRCLIRACRARAPTFSQPSRPPHATQILPPRACLPLPHSSVVPGWFISSMPTWTHADKQKHGLGQDVLCHLRLGMATLTSASTCLVYKPLLSVSPLILPAYAAAFWQKNSIPAHATYWWHGFAAAGGQAWDQFSTLRFPLRLGLTRRFQVLLRGVEYWICACWEATYAIEASAWFVRCAAARLLSSFSASHALAHTHAFASCLPPPSCSVLLVTHSCSYALLPCCFSRTGQDGVLHAFLWRLVVVASADRIYFFGKVWTCCIWFSTSFYLHCCTLLPYYFAALDTYYLPANTSCLSTSFPTSPIYIQTDLWKHAAYGPHHLLNTFPTLRIHACAAFSHGLLSASYPTTCLLPSYNHVFLPCEHIYSAFQPLNRDKEEDIW